MIIDDFSNPKRKLTVSEASAANDYFTRRKSEEDRIAGVKAPAKNKKNPANTDYAKKRKQQDIEESRPFRGTGGAFNRGDDERHDLDPTDWYKVKDGKMFRVSIYPRQIAQAEREGYSRTQTEAEAAAGSQGVEGEEFDAAAYRKQCLQSANNPKQCYTLGMNAFKRGLKTWDNPFKQGTTSHKAWAKGINDASMGVHRPEGVEEASKTANFAATPSKSKNQQEYDAIEKYRKDLAQTYNKPKKEQDVAEGIWERHNSIPELEDAIKNLIDAHKGSVNLTDKGRAQLLLSINKGKRILAKKKQQQQGVAEGKEQQWTVTVGTKTGGTSHTMTFSGTKEQAIKKAVARFGTSKNPVVNAVPAKQGVAEGSEEKGMAAYRKGAHDAHNDKEETNPYPSGTYDHGSYKSGYRVGLAHKDKEQGVAEAFPNPGSGNTGSSKEDKRIAAALRKKHIPTTPNPTSKEQGVAEGSLEEVSQDTARSYAQKARASQKDLINQTHRKGADTDALNKKIKNRQQGMDRAHTDKRYYKDEQGVAEGLPGGFSKSDYTPGATKKHVDTNCTTCHGRKGMYKLDGKLFADNKVGAVRVKCPICHGTGDKPDVTEDRGQHQQWGKKDMEKLRVATRDFDDIMASDGPEATKQNLIKKRIQTKPMAGPKGVLPEADNLSENAEDLHIGDPVIITGNGIKFEGATGEIVDFGRDNRFVVVNLYNHGKHSFHSSDVSFNEYAGSDDEEARMYDAGEFGDDYRNEMDEARMSAAQRLSNAWDKQRAKSDASLRRTPSSIPKTVDKERMIRDIAAGDASPEHKKVAIDAVMKTMSESRAHRQALMATMLNSR